MNLRSGVYHKGHKGTRRSCWEIVLGSQFSVLSKRQELFAESMEGRRDSRTSSNHFFNQISTRRFLSRPSSESLDATGSSEQKAAVVDGRTPRQMNCSLTDSARFLEGSQFTRALPLLSANPRRKILSPE